MSHRALPSQKEYMKTASQFFAAIQKNTHVRFAGKGLAEVLENNF
jgi:hypothetical protein